MPWAFRRGRLVGEGYKIEYLPIDALRPYPGNSRTHDAEQIAKIIRSIREFGWTNPVLIDEDNMIMAGHGRKQAAEAMGMRMVPCLRLMGLDEEQKRAYVLADNRLAEDAGWDQTLLRLELADLDMAGFDLSLTGFSEDEIKDLLATTEAGDGEGEPTEPEEYQITIFSKTEEELLAIKKLLGVRRDAMRIDARRVLVMLHD